MFFSSILALSGAETLPATPDELPFMPPLQVDEWYTVTIANVSVGYMHTAVEQLQSGGVSTLEMMDVQVSRGADTSRMAFETVFLERQLHASAPTSAGEFSDSGGVTVMSYDQRFANSVVSMNASFSRARVSLTSFNGEKEHISHIELDGGVPSPIPCSKQHRNSALATPPSHSRPPHAGQAQSGVRARPRTRTQARTRARSIRALGLNGPFRRRRGSGACAHVWSSRVVADLVSADEPSKGRLRIRVLASVSGNTPARPRRAGEQHIQVQTMRPELGPRVVNLTSTFTGVASVWDGEAMVSASIWTVQISDVPVKMSEAYPIEGPLRCYRMLQMGLDMPFGYLLAALSSQAAALAAAEDDPTRVLPELVYTMFVPVSRHIPDVYEASKVDIIVRVKSDKGPVVLELPSSGYQRVAKVQGQEKSLQAGC